jgi:hypothetical protein
LQEKLGRPESKELASKWYPAAQKAQQYSATAYNFIQAVKDSLLRAADFNPAENGDSAFKEDNLDISTRIMVEGGYGKELYQQLETFRNSLLNIDPKIKREFAGNLPIDLTVPKVQNPENNTFEAAYFRMTPWLQH